jgi:hypothetical protein
MFPLGLLSLIQDPTGLNSNMNHAASPSSSSIFSSSLDDSSITEQGSEVSGGGKPIGRIKRRLANQPLGRTGKKRQRTSTTISSSFALQPSGRKKGKGKSLPLRIPSGKAILGLNGVQDEGDQQNDDEESVHTSTVVLFRNTDEILQVRFLKNFLSFISDPSINENPQSKSGKILKFQLRLEFSN